MLKRKALKKIIITTLVFVLFIVISIFKDSKFDNVNVKSLPQTDFLYTINNDNYISKTSVYVDKELSIEDRIKEKLEIMTEKNNKNALLPSYFKPILPINTKVLDVVYSDSIVKVYFSKELLSINEEQSEKMIEAITYTILNDDVLGVEIYADGKMLKYVPHTKKALPTILDSDFGINKSYDISGMNDVVKIVMMYYGYFDNNYYEIPVTKYTNDSREKLEVIMEEFNGVGLNNLINYVENLSILDYKFKNKVLTLNINRNIDREESNIISNTIFKNYDIYKIIILVDGVKKEEKIQKNA